MLIIVLLSLLLSGCSGESSDPPLAQPQQASQPQPVAPTPAPPAEPPAPTVNVLHLAFTGTFGQNGTVNGTLEYVMTQGPIGTDVRAGNVKPNVVYQLQDYSFVVDAGGTTILPSGVYGKDLPSNSVEFCQGKCMFATPDMSQLTFKNGTGFELSLAFVLRDPTPLINPPSTFDEWGPLMLNASRYGVDPVTGAPVAFLQSGSLTTPQEE